MDIALANSEDIPELCSLLQSLFSQEIEFKPDHKLQVQGLSRILSNPDIGNIIIARESKKIVGMVNLLYTVSTALGGRVAILEDMVVNTAMRGKGIGSELLEYSFVLAKKNKCLRITLLTDHDNDRAHYFYLKHGFNRSSMTVFRKSLR